MIYEVTTMTIWPMVGQVERYWCVRNKSTKTTVDEFPCDSPFTFDAKAHEAAASLARALNDGQ